MLVGMHLLLCDIRDVFNFLDSSSDRSQISQLQQLVDKLSLSIEAIAKTVKDESSSKRRGNHITYCVINRILQ